MVSEVLKDIPAATQIPTQSGTCGSDFEVPYPARRISIESEDDPLARFKNSLNPDDFKEFMQQFEGPLRRFFLRRVRNVDLSEELTQQVFIKLLINSPGYDSTKGTLQGYVFRTAHHKLCDFYRTRGLQKEVNETDVGNGCGADCDSSGVFEAIAEDPNSSVPTDENPLPKIMDNLLDQLAPEQAILLRLWSIDTSYADIGEMLGLNEGTVKSRIHRAKADLKCLVEKRGGAEAKAAWDYLHMN